MAFDRKTYSHKGLNINYVQRGSGRPMLLLHGFGASTYSWRHIIENFSREYRVIAIDLKGFGLSDKPIDKGYAVKDQSEIVLEFIRENKLQDIILVGHSFGGAVALFSYLQMKKSNDIPVSKMILVDSASYKQESPYFIQILRTPLLNRLSLALLPDRSNTRMILKKAFYDDSKITDEMVNVYASYLGLPGAHHALIMTAEQIFPENISNLTHQYKAISIPVLLIWGDHDEIVPMSVGQKLSNDIPNAKLQIVKDCGHVPQEECPDTTVELFADFLRNCSWGM